MYNMIEIKNLFDLSHSLAEPLLSRLQYPWEALSQIKSYILQIGPSLPPEEYDNLAENVWIARSAKIAPTAVIQAPAIICAETEVRHCAYIRGSVIVGKNCVVGNSVEIKNAILFDNVQVPHFNYVGDSILGYKAHFGAGAITSNVKSDKLPVRVKCPGLPPIDTGLRKFGAMVGDHVELGCNAVLNPGTVIGRGTIIYPTSCVRGAVPENSIWKNTGEIIKKKEGV